MRSVKSNTAGTVTPAGGKTAGKRRDRPEPSTVPLTNGTAPTRRHRFRPASRAAWRLTILSTWVVIAGIAVPAGFAIGKAANDEYVFIVISFTIPLTLAFAFAAAYIAVATQGGLTRAPRIRFAHWPKRLRHLTVAAVTITATTAFATLIQHVNGALPDGLLIAAALAAVGATRDTVAVIRNHRAAREKSGFVA